MMIICYASYGLCMVLLAFSTSLWHFWVAIIFLKIGMVSMNVGAAFVADLVDQKALGRGMSLFQTMGFFALAVGCAVAGSAFQGFGIANASFMSTALPVIGIVLIISIRVVKQKEAIA